MVKLWYLQWGTVYCSEHKSVKQAARAAEDYLDTMFGNPGKIERSDGTTAWQNAGKSEDYSGLHRLARAKA